MENVSKALLMAGGMLIAIIIIVVLIKSYANIATLKQNQEKIKLQEEIEEFNKQYIKYVGQYVYRTEIITLKNKYDDNNKVSVIIVDDGKNGTEIYYKCTGVTYDNGGKVNTINFKKITIDAGV